MSIFRGISRRLSAASVAAWLERFYFEPAGPVGLVLCRVWIYGVLLNDCRRADYSRWSELTPELWQPILLFSWLPGPIFSSELLRGAQYLYMGLLLCCCLGLCFRWASIGVFGLALFLCGLPNCYGKVDHAGTLTIFALAILACSHAGRIGSVDAWIARWRGGTAQPAVSSEYQWPLRLLQALMATVFMAAGIAKLSYSGLAWIASDNMQNVLLACYYTGKDPPTQIGLWVAQIPWLCQALAAMTVFVELTAPLALISRRYRWFVIPSLLGMQLGIYYVMGINFWHYVMLYFIWIEWNEITAWIADRMKHSKGTLRAGKTPAETPILSHG